MNNKKPDLPHDHDSRTSHLVEAMPEMATFEKTAEIFSMISDSSRVKILWMLCHTEDCVSNIAAVAEMSVAAASHHLRMLKQAGVLSSRRVGKEIWYTLADNDLALHVHRVVDSIFDMNCEI